MSAAVAVRERPLLMSGEMVRATLEDRKTKTRRVVTRATSEVGTGLPWNALDWSRAQVDPGFGADQYLHVGGPDDTMHRVLCRYAVGDRVWVRETWECPRQLDGSFQREKVKYGADRDFPAYDYSNVVWRPSIHMPRWASRLTLEITDVRVERVQDISEEDARAEGIWEYGVGGGWKIYTPTTSFGTNDPRKSFLSLWDSINAARGYGWDANPWVWCLSFRRVES